MSKILIVEDDPIIATDLRMIVQKQGHHCEQADNGSDAKQLLASHTFDLCLLDIGIEGDTDGVELGGHIRSVSGAPIIFLTSYFDAQTIDRVRPLNPEAFIVKPFEERNLIVNMELAMFKAKNQGAAKAPAMTQEKLFVKHNGELKAVAYDDILYLEAEDNYSYVHTSEAKYLLSYPMKSLEEKVNSPGFMRIHRSYIVNLDKVTSIQEGCVMLGKVQLPLSRTYRTEFVKSLKVL